MSSARRAERGVLDSSVEWTLFEASEVGQRRLSGKVRIEDAWSTLTFWASVLRGHHYFDPLGISILLTLMESPFSSPVRLTV